MPVKETGENKEGTPVPSSSIPTGGKTFRVDEVEVFENAVNLLFNEWRPPKNMTNQQMLGGTGAFQVLEEHVKMMRSYIFDNVRVIDHSDNQTSDE